MTMKNIESLISTMLSLLSNENLDVEVKEGDNFIYIKYETPKQEDNTTKQLVSQFKQMINSLPEWLFTSVLEDVENHIDLCEFNELYNKESYTKEESSIVEYMITYMKNEIIEHIDNEIARLEELKNTLIG